MEKITFKNKRGLRIVGDYYPTNSTKGIICCHGFTGDRHEGGKFDMLCEQLQQKGYNCLTFDFSGSGESDDEALNTENQAQDFLDAINYMKQKGITTIGAVGMSLGPIAILKNKQLFDKIIKTVVLWCPVTYKKDNYALYRFNQEQIQELKEKGIITYKKIREGKPRQEFIIDKQIITERENINQKEFLSNINIPILIIHGDKDTSVPLNWSKEAMQYLPKKSQLEIINGSGHIFNGYKKEVITKTTIWFTKHL